jgi:predicted membrane chloride channel (bestrophin family)
MLSKVKHGDSIGYLSAIRFLEYQKIVAFKIKDWLYNEITSEEMIKLVSGMNTYFIELDAEGVPAIYIIKMKNEQNNLRKIILRIDTIRKTDFISSAYAIVESMAFIISIGLVFINIEAEKQNLFAEVFFTLLVSFLIFYMIALIKDIDDPFDYQNNGESGSEINLDVFNDHLKSLK